MVETSKLLAQLLRAPGQADGGGEAAAAVADADALVRARRSGVPAVLAAAALRSRDGDADALLARARDSASTTRERQLVELAAAHLAGDHDRFDALVRDHLADHPDDLVAAWIADRHTP